jgi:hypothetical protein
MAARIDHERTEREALEQQRQELLKRKQKLIAENKRRKDDLANLDQDLEKFIDVCDVPSPSANLPPQSWKSLILDHRLPNPYWSYSKRHREGSTQALPKRTAGTSRSKMFPLRFVVSSWAENADHLLHYHLEPCLGPESLRI